MDPEDGWVGVVHEPTSTDGAFRASSKNLFPVRWEGGRYPSPADGCQTGNTTDGIPSQACYVLPDGDYGPTCMCDVALNVTAVFTDLSALPTAAQAADALAIGAAPVSVFDAGEYTECATAACAAAAPDVTVYLHSSSGGSLDAASVFRVRVNSTRVRYLLNKRPDVRLGSAFAFRNPPHFLSFVEPTKRDALYETEALLDHLFLHPNLAPFVSYRLIQRLTTSNPSPRYIQAVGAAFTTGAYDGHTYGGGYGDLGAAVAATLLDREARSSTLDLDPSHGQLREPLLKVLHLLRSLEYASDSGREVELSKLSDKVGQAIFESPTVFNCACHSIRSCAPCCCCCSYSRLTGAGSNTASRSLLARLSTGRPRHRSQSGLPGGTARYCSGHHRIPKRRLLAAPIRAHRLRPRIRLLCSHHQIWQPLLHRPLLPRVGPHWRHRWLLFRRHSHLLALCWGQRKRR